MQAWNQARLTDEPTPAPASADALASNQAGPSADTAAHWATPRAGHRTEGTRPGAQALLLMTGLGAADGTIVVLAAAGLLSSWAGAIGIGLTVVAGAGAWITAQQAFGGRHRTRRDLAALGAIALTTSLAVVLAAWLGAHIGATASLLVLPRVAGLALLLIAVEMAGWRLPRLPGVRQLPIPVLVVAAGLIAEVLHWTLS